MKLREALEQSNCGAVKNINTGIAYYTYEGCDTWVGMVEYITAEQDIWEPINEKKPTKTKLEGWVNVYPDKKCFHETKEESNSHCDAHRIACVYVSGEYECDG